MKPCEAERKFAAGERIVECGSAARELYVVASGEVRLETDPPELLGPGDLFGELSAILGSPCPAGAVAESDATVLVIDILLLNRLCQENSEFSFRLIRHLARALESAVSGPMQEAQVLPETAGLARVIEVIFERSEEATDPDSPPRVVATLRELAADADLTIPEAYNCLQQLFEARYLRLVEGYITILNGEALRDVARASSS
jgi:CRP/FNR family cyclic AMP-dependent transcriptional regulator